MFDLHELQESDFDNVVDLVRVIQQECEPDIPVVPAEVYANMIRCVNQPVRDYGNVWCVYRNKTLIGIGAAYISTYFYSTKKMSSLNHWCVLPEYRHTRAAAGILRAFEKWSRANGVYRMHIGADRIPIDEADKINAAISRLGYKHHGDQFYKLAV